MKVGIPKEVPPERRVAATPETVRSLVQMGLEVLVEAGAGEGSGIGDRAYQESGAKIEADAAVVLSAEVVLKVDKPSPRPGLGEEANLLAGGAVLVGLLAPAANAALVEALAKKGATSFAMELVPRIARAQAMDALSSMSTIAGYRAAILAAEGLQKMMPMMMTAAGTLQAANALVIGAGVAGLEAIAVLRKLGANVRAIDVRPVVKEQVESLGAKFIPLSVHHDEAQTQGGYAKDLGESFYRQEQELIAPHMRGVDIVITSALVPQRRAPVMITADMVGLMAPGGVIVDLAAAQGGNCALTQAGKIVLAGSVRIIGPLNLPSELAVHASQLYARNVLAFLKELMPQGAVKIDLENEIIRSMLLTHEGRVVQGFSPEPAASPASPAQAKETP